MSDEQLIELVERYREAFERGEAPDLADYLNVAGDLADDFLAIVELTHLDLPAPLDMAAIEAFAADPRSAPTFGELLTAAREARGLLRRDLVDGLVAALALPARVRSRVDQRLHEVEIGLLQPTRVAPRALQALGDLLGGIGDALRVAPAGRPPATEAVFQRLGSSIVQPASAPRAAAPAQEVVEDPALVEVDTLFGVDV